jgi:hypothetical protein
VPIDLAPRLTIVLLVVAMAIVILMLLGVCGLGTR